MAHSFRFSLAQGSLPRRPEAHGRLDAQFGFPMWFRGLSLRFFFSKGFTMAFSRDFGIVPLESDTFITLVMVGRTSSMQSKRTISWPEHSEKLWTCVEHALCFKIAGKIVLSELLFHLEQNSLWHVF